MKGYKTFKKGLLLGDQKFEVGSIYENTDTNPYNNKTLFNENPFDTLFCAGFFDIFGELRDTCRHIRNPISRMIVNKNQNEYEGQWDGWIEYGEQYELCEKLYRKISDEIKEGSYVPDKLREFIEKNDEYNGTELIQEIVHEYELLAHPYKTPWKKLKEAYAEWRKDFIWRHFKCYFRREM